MSLDNTPKIDWTTADGVSNTDLDNIGNNLQALEDSKYQETDDLTTTTATITTVNASNMNVSGYTTGNYKSSDGSAGINDQFYAIPVGESGTWIWTVKDGLIVSKVAIP